MSEPTPALRNYEALAARVLRLGEFLISPASSALSRERWDGAFACYQAELTELRRLGDQLRPVTLRERTTPAASSAATDDLRELFGETS